MYDQKQKEVFQRVKATFPDIFGLRAYPGETFRISDTSSYFGGSMLSCEESDLMLYTERKVVSSDGRGEVWVDFAKATVNGLRSQVVTEPTSAEIGCSFTNEELIDLHEGLMLRICVLRKEKELFGSEVGRKAMDEGIAHLTTLAIKVMALRNR